jgi:hypothetical protein
MASAIEDLAARRWGQGDSIDWYAPSVAGSPAARRPPLAGALGADGRQPERHLADDKDDPGDRRA